MSSTGAATRVAYGEPETRRRILEAAREVLEGRGADLRIADVAARAGVSRQAVYLHFGDRAGLLIALVDFIDTSQGVGEFRASIAGAPSGVEALHRLVERLSWYTASIDRVTEVLEAGQDADPALGAAWRDRMARRQAFARSIVARIAHEGDLAPGWTVESAAQMVYLVCMPGPWREAVRRLGWTREEYAERVFALLSGALVAVGERGTLPT